MSDGALEGFCGTGTDGLTEVDAGVDEEDEHADVNVEEKHDPTGGRGVLGDMDAKLNEKEKKDVLDSAV